MDTDTIEWDTGSNTESNTWSNTDSNITPIFGEMNIMVIGSGGREHAICKAISKSNKLNRLHCYGTHYNPGILELGCIIEIGTLKHNHSIISYAMQNNINLVIIGPEAPLQNNLATDLYLHNIACIGPISSYAMIETNKAFARDILNSIHPEVNPPFRSFSYESSLSSIVEFIETLNDNIVIKANGLKGGKGVKVSGDHFNTREEGLDYINELIKNKDNFVIEEKLVGREFSLMSFSDGTHLSHMPIIRDFKRAYEGDNGPNTGSMGSISYKNHLQPFLTEVDVLICQKINYDVVNYLKEYYCNHPFVSKHSYKGILYGSFMKTDSGEIKVIEFNARFGDPEVINVLSILKTDFLEICEAIVNGNLNELEVEYEEKYTVCRYLVPYGYPLNPIKNRLVYLNHLNFIYASAECDLAKWAEMRKYKDIVYLFINFGGPLPPRTWEYLHYVNALGSRAIALIGKGDTMKEARDIIENDVNNIFGPLFMRKDIGYDETFEIYKTSSKYEEAGVSIDEGNKFVSEIKSIVESTHNDNVESTIGDFGGIYNISKMINANGLQGELCLISSTDGVGTKSVFIEDYFGKDGYGILGKDLVNHCINDILVQGGKPLYFLDYFASSKLDSEAALEFIKGISFSCNKYCCALIGGETAEMPDVYKDNRCDFVGTIIGIVEKENIIHSKNNVMYKNLVVSLKSSGPHTNGYSLIRKILNELGTPEENIQNYQMIIDRLAQPHRCYLDDYNLIIKNDIKINGMCHITGGGLIENTKRILNDDLYIEYFPVYNTETGIYKKACYNYTPEFKFLKEKGNVTDEEMNKVFNCGYGMLLFLDNTNENVGIIEMLNEHYNDSDYAKVIGFVNSKI